MRIGSAHQTILPVIYENLKEWQGRKVEDYTPGQVLGDPSSVAYRLRVDWDSEDSLLDRLAALATTAGADEIEELVIGAWTGDDPSIGSEDAIVALAAAREQFPKLRHLFFGDIISEENEISWIEQGDMSPILTAYPQLETLTVRGSNGLSFGRPDHASLKTLHVQAGGLPATILHELAESNLPALEDLEVWLGEENYGGDSTVEDVAALLRPGRFPKLNRLAIKNCPFQNDVAALLAASPILERIKHLDIGMGSLTDEGVDALIAGGKLGGLESVSLDHHFVSDAAIERLKAVVPHVSAEDRQDEDQWGGQSHRFIAVSE